jgi:predicted RNA-binding protein with PIN domain
MPCLIDGYNLIHAMGIVPPKAGPEGLRRARLRLLALLAGTYGRDSTDVTVVFDAAGAPAGAQPEQVYEGIRLRFAVRPFEADDLIEDLIRHAAAPRQLVVVSDDHRIQRAARRRRCEALGCAEYLERLERQRRERGRPHAGVPAKPERVSPEEAARWLQEFADWHLERGLKELSDPEEFLEADP